MIGGTIQETDHVGAMYLHVKPRPIYAILGGCILLLFAWASYVSPSWWALFAPAGLICLFGIAIPWRARRTYRQYKALSEHSTIEVRDDGIFFRRQNGEGLVPWAQIIKWRRNRRLVLLYPASTVFYLIPSHFFDSNESFERFARTIEEHVGRAV
jgi:hypothetical protein